MSIEELQAENAALNEKCAKLETTVMALRFASNNPDLEDALERRTAAVSVVSPAVGTRVRVTHPGSKYAHKDFAASFDGVKIDFLETVEADAMGFVLAKAPHFKKASIEVYLIKFDSGKGAIFARKGVEPVFWDGCHVTIRNVGCKYASKDFGVQFASQTLIDQCRVGDRGVIVKAEPHYKNTSVNVFLVAVDSQMRCVVMNGKGLAPREIPGLKELVAKRDAEEAEKLAAAKAEADKEAAAKAEAEKKVDEAAAPEKKADEAEAPATEAPATEELKRKAEDDAEDEPAAKKAKEEA